MRLLTLLGLSALSWGCASATPAASSPQAAEPSSEEQAGEKAAGEKSGPPADVLYPAPPAVPPAPTSCIEGRPLPEQKPCAEAREDLATALGQLEDSRDAALTTLEACSDFPPGMVRALRADLAPAECGDVLVQPVVGEGVDSKGVPADIRETLVALGLGARLRRLAVDPPAAPESREKGPLEEYFKSNLFPWIGKQAQAIFEMASQGTHLSGYARGVVAIEAGNADMRFVEIAREAPLADEIAEHQEAKDLYYATLDEQLEPRKARGRNAALVGLREMARLGVRSSERVNSARGLLSKVYGGRRVNALDTLLVPYLAEEKAEGAQPAIASRVPTAYATSLVGIAKPTPQLVRAHLQMGMPPGLANDVKTNGSKAAQVLLARALFENGRTYFRSADFQATQALLSSISDSSGAGAGAGELDATQQEEVRLLRALSVALSAGPKDAAEMIAQGPRFADSLGNLAILDGLAQERSELGGRAAFNATYLRELVAPEGAPDYWADLGKRYLGAAKKLKGDEARISRERGQACLEIARELRKAK